MTKVDPYNIKEKYAKWQANALTNGIVGVSSANSAIVIHSLKNMQIIGNI